MKLTKRDGIWQLDYRTPLGKRRRVSTGRRDKAEAEKVAHAIIAGVDPRSDNWTVKDAIDHTMKTIWQHQKSTRSRMSVAKQINAEIGNVALDKLDYRALQEYATALLESGRMPATVNRRLAALSKALKEAHKMGRLVALPPIPKQIERNKRLRWLTGEEEQRLYANMGMLTKARAEQLEDVLVFLLDTGCRLGEMSKLEPEDVTGGRAVFRDTKNGESRSVPLTRRARAAAGRLLSCKRFGTLMAQSALHKQFDRVRRAADLRDVTLHTMRHTCASRLVQRGVDLYRVKEWLGHSTITVTERYAHLAPTSLDDVVSVLDTEDCGSGTFGHSANIVSGDFTKNRR